jgi:hypothetical protein
MGITDRAALFAAVAPLVPTARVGARGPPALVRLDVHDARVGEQAFHLRSRCQTLSPALGSLRGGIPSKPLPQTLG